MIKIDNVSKKKFKINGNVEGGEDEQNKVIKDTQDFNLLYPQLCTTLKSEVGYSSVKIRDMKQHAGKMISQMREEKTSD